jgi:hypothetical protein
MPLPDTTRYGSWLSVWKGHPAPSSNTQLQDGPAQGESAVERRDRLLGVYQSTITEGAGGGLQALNHEP